MMEIAGLSRHAVDAFGTRIHVAEVGSGPMVLFIHGFPESWYSWRHQMSVVAEAGMHAVAIDVRGYGLSDAPEEVGAYRLVDLVGDCVGVVEALGEETAVIVGHDWGSPIAAAAARLRPDVFTAVALLSVAYEPRSDLRPTDAFKMMGGDDEFYIKYFQEPGRAEAEIVEDPEHWLEGFYFTASGDCPPFTSDEMSMGLIAPGGKMSDSFRYPEQSPNWMTADDLAFYVAEFARSGFTGGLNRYRCVDLDWIDMRAWHGAPIRQPSLFIGGEKDGPTIWGAGSISRFPQTLPGLRASVILPGVGHWMQQEDVDGVNAVLLDFLESLS